MSDERLCCLYNVAMLGTQRIRYKGTEALDPGPCSGEQQAAHGVWGLMSVQVGQPSDSNLVGCIGKLAGRRCQPLTRLVYVISLHCAEVRRKKERIDTTPLLGWSPFIAENSPRCPPGGSWSGMATLADLNCLQTLILPCLGSEGSRLQALVVKVPCAGNIAHVEHL